MTLSAGSRLGLYEILAPLGAGGMGEVWRARDSKLGREVALKVLPAEVAADPERLERFEREAQLLAALNHPHIAAIYGVEDSTPTKALVLELVEGATLEDRIAQGPLPLAEAIPIARQIAEALEAAHERGIVHRDLKPANVKLNAEGQVKVLDFGLAKALDPVQGASGLGTTPSMMNSPTLTTAGTRLGVILGTAAYMAPEQARGRAVDKRADLWALGVVLYEMLTGRRLFSGETVSDTLAFVLTRDIDLQALPATTPPSVRRVLQRLLERDPARRLRSAGDAALELGEMAQIEAPPRAAGWRWAGLGALGGALVAFAVAAALGFGHRAGPEARSEVRLLLAAPEGSTFHDVPMVSPDGKRLAFLARSAGTHLSLQVRGLDGSVLAPLAQFDNALDSTGNHPAWSPDGSALAFCDGHKLQVAELAGSALRAIADCTSTARGVAWGREGILYAPDSNGPVMAVAPAGGAPRIATPFDDKVPDLSHRFPSFLADGRHFLYLAWSNAAGAPAESLGIFLADVESDAVQKISDLRTNAVVVSDGERSSVLYRREGNLVAAGFDSARARITGGESVVDAQTQTFGNGGYAYFSANSRGDVLSLPPQSQQISVLNFLDRQGSDRGVLNVPAVYGAAAVSPDGRQLAALETDVERGVDDLWVIDLERQVPTRLTRGGDTHIGISWRPDSRAIAYATQTTGDNQPYAIDIDGATAEQRLATTPTGDNPVAFSPDGAWLVLQRRATDRRLELWAHSQRDSHEVTLCRLPSGDCRDPFLSPDGRYFAFVSNYSGRDEVYVRPFLSDGPQLRISSDGGQRPHWSKDGREIVYQDAEGWVVAVPIATQPELRAQPATRLLVISTDSIVAPLPDHSQFIVNGRSAGGAALARVILGWHG